MAGLLKKMFGVFQSANDTENRSQIDFPVTSARKEIKPYEREAIQKKGAWLYNNFGLVRAIANKTARYSVPLIPTPTTTDTEWNKIAYDDFYTWASNKRLCDPSGRHNFWKKQKLTVRALFRHGEIFHNLIKSEKGTRQIQTIDALSVKGKGKQRTNKSLSWWDGILLNDLERAIAYNVKRNEQEDQEIDEDFVIHVYDAERTNQARGLSWLYTGINSCVDVMDLNALEKQAVKLHAALAAVVKKKKGEAGKGGLTGRLTLGDDGDKKKPLEEISGVLVNYLNTDEDLDLKSSGRPSPTYVGFIDFLMRDIAAGAGVAVEFIWSLAGMGGANTRFILADNQAFFDDVGNMLVDEFCQRVYVWYLSSRIKDYRESGGKIGIRPPKDPNWMNAVEWMGPAKVTVDNGRDGKLDIQKMEKGMLTHDEYWKSRNKDPVKMENLRIEEIKRQIDKCKEAGVPFGLFYSFPKGLSIGESKEGTVSESESNTKTSEPDFETLKSKFDAFGVGVRSGAITPQQADEDAFRDEAGFPIASDDVKAAWADDGGVRRPITLQSQSAYEETQEQIAGSDNEEEETEEETEE